ncbi:ABC transporter permease [Alkalihalobacillus oceani]|uniref:FtsX-like permease family protein n=1 Tax=Halalkalibacter oceani TaxID=1653776 RepID=UPI00203D35D6|nr:ABC transporter permease [Halalkalibacter oceani]MCM3762682.1 ABC transporter permease [Halalkalibacter oceani]
MSFNQIVWKMAKVHYRKYIFYYLCNSFAVMFFFIFATVFFNEQVVEVKQTESIQYLLTIPGLALLVFTVFFISYAHSIFIKRRKSEFALFLTLGMANRDIARLLLLENVIIAAVSLLSGLLAGAVFSRLFFLLLMSGVGLKGVSFHLNSQMWIYTIIAFLLVFSVAVGRSLFSILNESLATSLKSDKVAEALKLKSPLFGAMGIIIMIVSLVGLYYTYATSNNGGEFLLLWTLTTLTGLYISIYQFTSFFIELAKKNKAYYYRRLLLLTALDYKFKQLTAILMLVSVMIMVTILYSTILLFTYQATGEEVISQYPYDISFIETDQKNHLTETELYAIIDQDENPVREHLIIPVYSHYQQSSYGGLDFYHFMSLDQFNTFTAREIMLENDEILYYLDMDPAYSGDTDYIKAEILPLPDERPYRLKEIIIEKRMNFSGPFIVLNHSQLEFVKQQVDGFEARMHLINVENWKETTDVVGDLQRQFSSYNERTPAMIDVAGERDVEQSFFYVDSKVEGYSANKSSNGILFFVTTILSILFFFGSFILLSLNFFSGIEKEKEKFKKLNQIGITAREGRAIMTKEMTALFFFPTLIGTTLAFLYLVAMARDVGGVLETPIILLHFLIIAAIYHIIQIGFYLYVRKKMIARVMAE